MGVCDLCQLNLCLSMEIYDALIVLYALQIFLDFLVVFFVI